MLRFRFQNQPRSFVALDPIEETSWDKTSTVMDEEQRSCYQPFSFKMSPHPVSQITCKRTGPASKHGRQKIVTVQLKWHFGIF